MANLIKASTARKHADAFDLGQAIMDRVAGDISQAAAEGNYGIEAWVPPGIYDSISAKLTKAGYRIVDTSLQASAPVTVNSVKTNKGFFGKLLDKITGGVEDEVYYTTPEPYGFYFIVTWGDEPKDVE